MVKRLLFIAPRWMSVQAIVAQIEKRRARFPKAQCVLLAAQSEVRGMETWSLPPKSPRARAAFLWRLRRRRFDLALVLTDDGRGDAGYGEAKFWALAANARRRGFGAQTLSWRLEVRAKKPLALLFVMRGLVRALEKIKSAARSETASEGVARGARTFVYLQHAEHAHGAPAGRVLLLGEVWDEDAARRCGWEPVGNSREALPVRLILARGAAEMGLVPLESGGLLCVSGRGELAFSSHVVEVENRAAFFEDGARDVWLVSR